MSTSDQVSAPRSQHPAVKCDRCEAPWDDAMWGILDDANFCDLSEVDVSCGVCGHVIQMTRGDVA